MKTENEAYNDGAYHGLVTGIIGCIAIFILVFYV